MIVLLMVLCIIGFYVTVLYFDRRMDDTLIARQARVRMMEEEMLKDLAEMRKKKPTEEDEKQ